MKIIITSDLHGNLPLIPEGDLLLICGDIVPLRIQSDDYESKQWFKNDFKNWIDKIPVKKVIFIAGNHDWMAYNDKGIWLHENFNIDSKVTYIQDELIEYEGIKIYGTPWCKIFYNWAFMVDDEELNEYFENIPENLDILITHDAPEQNRLGIIHEKPYIGVNASNKILTQKVINKNPKYHFCGHIHSGNHNLNKEGNTYFANCSCVNERYNLVYDPLIIEL